MKIHKWTSKLRTNAVERDLCPRQRALLAANIADERHKAWALEMLGRRDAVARWRGQPGCSVRDVIRDLAALPAWSSFALPDMRLVVIAPTKGENHDIQNSQ